MRAESELRRAQQAVATELYENSARQAVVKMGGGKTAAAMTAIKELIEDGHIRCALGLAPKRVAQLVWTKEHKLWEHLQHLRVSLVAGTPAQRKAALLDADADIYIVGIDNTQWLCEQLVSLPEDHKLFDLLFIDELSRFKNPSGKRARSLSRLAKRWRARWGLTGTPRPNGYEDQFTPLSLLTQNRLWGKSFYKWREQRFMPLDFMRRNWSIRPEWRDRTIADIDTVTITISESDMPDLPPLTSVFHWVDLPPSVMSTYRKMERELFAKHGNNPAVIAANAAVATMKLAQIVQGFLYEEDGTVQHIHTEKADQLAELVEDLNGNPVLVAYDFREDLHVMQGMWKGLPFLGAGVSDKLAATHEEKWNKGEYPILALHPASAGHGLNLQFGGSQMIWYGMTWSAELYDQTLKRFHRPGQGLHCFAHHILARNTIDEVKYSRVVEKMAAQTAFEKYLRRV